MYKEQNYIPGSMSFAEGFCADRKSVGFSMIYSPTKVKMIIESMMKEGREIEYAMVGLDGDWKENSDIIYKDGEFKHYYHHNRSVWAEPILIINYKDGPSEAFSVWEREKK